MKRAFFIALALIAAWPITASAQGFNSGSDGSMGPLVVSGTSLLIVPPDGKFHYTTIMVTVGGTIQFARNALNTPVYLLATSNVVIQGTINANGSPAEPSSGGLGGPGGFDGGGPNGAGLGPGGGLPGLNENSPAGAGSGTYSLRSPNADEPSTNKGSTYGSPLLVPMVGGSGGGGRPDFGGGGGGGAITIASSTRIDLLGGGEITARGGFANGAAKNYGSGGAVRLVANTVAGTGTISVHGPNLHKNLGRVRIDAIDRSGVAFVVPTADATIPPPLSLGSFMTVFPPGNPRLDIIEVAGTLIPEGTNTPVTITLPFGSNPNQNVVVRARDFNDAFTFQLILTPQSGRPVGGGLSHLMDNSTGNPTTVTVSMTFPINTPVTVQAFRR